MYNVVSLVPVKKDDMREPGQEKPNSSPCSDLTCQKEKHQKHFSKAKQRASFKEELLFCSGLILFHVIFAGLMFLVLTGCWDASISFMGFGVDLNCPPPQKNSTQKMRVWADTISLGVTQSGIRHWLLLVCILLAGKEEESFKDFISFMCFLGEASQGEAYSWGLCSGSIFLLDNPYNHYTMIAMA